MRMPARASLSSCAAALRLTLLRSRHHDLPDESRLRLLLGEAARAETDPRIAVAPIPPSTPPSPGARPLEVLDPPRALLAALGGAPPVVDPGCMRLAAPPSTRSAPRTRCHSGAHEGFLGARRL